MKTALFAAAVALTTSGAWAQNGPINFLGFDDASQQPAAYHAGQFMFKKANHTPDTKMVKEVKAAIIEVLAVVKWDDVADADLPFDPKKISPFAIDRLQEMTPEEFKKAEDAFEKKNKRKFPRVAREDLPSYSAIGSGTGFIIKTDDGRVLAITNAHVVNGLEEVKKKIHAKPELHIKLSDDQFAHNPDASDMVAEIGAVGKHGMDVAFLKIPAQRNDGQAWSTLKLADSATVEQGEQAWAMGFPMGLNYTTTRGIVSAVHVSIDNPYVGYVQTDAAINPGNSGGPLIRLAKHDKPEVIGMNTQIVSRSGASSGLGFAIEANNIKRALAQYLRTGSIDVGYIGMTFGAGKGANRDKVTVQTVAAGSPAAKAGVQPGDVIKNVGGKDLATNPASAMFQVARAVKSKDPGEAIELLVSRSGQDVKVSVTVEKEPEELPDSQAKAASEPDGEESGL